jgi:SAM-dependent methyltransferase
MQLHSAQYLLSKFRDFYWNLDHLALIASRLDLDDVGHALDVGCGIGHWTFALASVLPPHVRWTGVDSEQEWVRRAGARAAQLGLAERSRFAEGDAQALAFEDASFDLATCQTLMQHLPDPQAAIVEMLRVTRPGGLILISELNNLSALAGISSVNVDTPVDEVVDLFRFGLTCERGKRALGEGNDSIGNLIPGYLALAGAVDIQTFIADKTHSVFPPYDSEEQQTCCEHLGDPEAAFWPRDQTRRYFLAGGGVEADFDSAWQRRVEECRRDAQAIKQSRLFTAGGFTIYLTAARRPG